ncbi:MAG: nuclear transport factor 2 family protein [Acidobacteriaceae bacterium]|nr:nuclear transport factor 2 family protein [Acidobacteriaceae bacterium]
MPVESRRTREPVTLTEQSAVAPPSSVMPSAQSPAVIDRQPGLFTLVEAQRVEAEAEAWRAVDTTQRASLEHFVEIYPAGEHASDARRLLQQLSEEQAVHALDLAEATPVNDFAASSEQREAEKLLSEISFAPSREWKEIVAALESYSEAWNTKDVAKILALRPTLGRRTVKEELSSTRSITMRIQPTSVPRIEGDRATVDCIHEVDQVFTDGTDKQNPGTKMTYVLVRRGGSWLIADSR